MNTSKLIFLMSSAVFFAACNQESVEQNTESATPATEPATTQAMSVEIVPGLKSRIIRSGSGAVAEAGQIVTVHYTGWLLDETAENSRGEKFDSSVDRDQYFQFPLGAGRVIKGWDQGVVGMNVGEIRELTIAPEMAYGDRQVGSVIGPGSTLVFEVELIGLTSPAEEASE